MFDLGETTGRKGVGVEASLGLEISRVGGCVGW